MTPSESTSPDSPLPARSESETTLHLAYAQAAVMLIENLMALLAERKVLSLEELVETVETAIETKRNFVREREHPEIAAIAAGVLTSIANSLAATDRVAPHA
jgi:hypothetical protein